MSATDIEASEQLYVQHEMVYLLLLKTFKNIEHGFIVKHPWNAWMNHLSGMLTFFWFLVLAFQLKLAPAQQHLKTVDMLIMLISNNIPINV